ncbi:MAG TPA: triple tyrosine motif-containing protein, partial [Roseimicrobium sp.]|nr:triple tyrosine motif-containing protein [Roseimicrobium sp.]
IEDIIADGESILTGPAPKVLPGKERLEFHYTGLSFIAPKRVTFQYRLEGLDLNWIQADSRRAAIYMNVPAGKYTFRVMAANNDGVWNEIGASMAFTVLPPFWKTWWFASISGCVLVLLVWGFLRYLSIRKLRRQVIALQHQHALEKERARIAQDMHDDLGASITQIGLLCELMKRQVDTKQDVAPLADRMIGTSRDVVNTLDEIVWAVNPKNDRLNQLGDYITQYGEDYFDASPIRCRMDVPTNLPATPLSAEMRHNLFMVVKEAFNNIVKHSKATEVWLRLSIEGSVLVLVIEDNGKGFSLDKTSHRRNGLQNMKKRIEESGGSFGLTTEPGKGTRIVLRVNLPAEGA